MALGIPFQNACKSNWCTNLQYGRKEYFFKYQHVETSLHTFIVRTLVVNNPVETASSNVHTWQERFDGRWALGSYKAMSGVLVRDASGITSWVHWIVSGEV